MTTRQIIRNAKKAALRDGYNQLIYIDNNGEYWFVRDYPAAQRWDIKKVIGKIIADWNGGILKTKFIKESAYTKKGL